MTIRNKKGFTLTELMIALGVIGVLTAILMPIIFNIMPDKNALMAKRAYYTIQTVISDLINDSACYPDMTYASTDARVGFDDGYGYADCSDWNSAIDTEGDANQKFLTLFTNKLDLKDDVTPTSGVSSLDFSTKDGMKWTASSLGFTTKNSNGANSLMTIDVNGDDKPNCKTASDTGCTNRTKGFDRFDVKIYANGKLEIVQDWAKKAVDANKDISGKN